MEPKKRMTAGWFLAAFTLASVGLAGIDFKEGLGLRQLGERRVAAKSAAEVLPLWPAASRAIAAQLMDKYGAPDAVEEDGMVWRRRGDWLWIAVHRDIDFSKGYGCLQHAVRYETPIGRWRDLDTLAIGVQYEPIGEVLTAASDSEAANILALNLAVDVVEGRLSAGQARALHAKTLDLALSGKSSASMRKLLFKPARRPKPRQPGQLWPMP